MKQIIDTLIPIWLEFHNLTSVGMISCNHTDVDLELTISGNLKIPLSRKSFPIIMWIQIWSTQWFVNYDILIQIMCNAVSSSWLKVLANCGLHDCNQIAKKKHSSTHLYLNKIVNSLQMKLTKVKKLCSVRKRRCPTMTSAYCSHLRMNKKLNHNAITKYYHYHGLRRKCNILQIAASV